MPRHYLHLSLAVVPGLLVAMSGLMAPHAGAHALLTAGGMSATGGLLAGLVLRYLGRGGVTALTGGLMAGFAIRLATVISIFLIVRHLDGAAAALTAGGVALAVGAVADAALLANHMRQAPLAEVHGG